MINKPNILLIGKMGAGKSTIAQRLCQYYGYVCIPLATKLKQEAERLLGRPIDKKRDRRFLQLLGQALRNGVDKNYFCDDVKNKIALLNHKLYNKNLLENLKTEMHNPFNYPPIVIDDCRFQNEAAYFQKLGFITVRLNILDSVRTERLEKRDGKYENMQELENDSSENGFNEDFTPDYELSLLEWDTKEEMLTRLIQVIGANISDEIREEHRSAIPERVLIKQGLLENLSDKRVM